MRFDLSVCFIFTSKPRLICFQHVSSTTLEAFMNDETFTPDAKLLYQLAADVLHALQFISSCGIHHNNVNMRNVLITKTDEEVSIFLSPLPDTF